MRSFLLGAFLVVAALKSSGRGAPLPQSSIGVVRPVEVSMETLRDRYRPLLVFAPSDNSARLAEQLRLLAAAPDALRERQVLLVPITGGSDRILDAGNRKMPELGYLSPGEAIRVRRRFHASEGEFTVVLIGKDGGEKFRTHAPVTIEKLKALIDAMPMRQQEERDGRAK